MNKYYCFRCKKDYKNQIEKELRWFIDTPYHIVPNFINLNKSKIKPSSYYKYLYIGNGNTVIDQELDVAGKKYVHIQMPNYLLYELIQQLATVIYQLILMV